jgi:hypothetical protein
MPIGVRDQIRAVLKALPNQYFTAKELAKLLVDAYPTESKEKMDRSRATVNPIDSIEKLISQLAAEIWGASRSIKRKDPNFEITGDRPARYGYLNPTSITTINDAQTTSEDSDDENDTASNKSSFPGLKSSATPDNSFKESELYPLLGTFLFREFHAHSMRINEATSSNSKGPKGNKWLHPDLVAIRSLTFDWDAKTKELASKTNASVGVLYSFEVKKSLKLSNIREAYFQAVSNSSWSNFGYLVTAEIDEDAQNEARILAGTHGIGLIVLKRDQVNESFIAIPARERTTLDWDGINRILKENKDFKLFIEEIIDWYKVGKFHSAQWYSTDL